MPPKTGRGEAIVERCTVRLLGFGKRAFDDEDEYLKQETSLIIMPKMGVEKDYLANSRSMTARDRWTPSATEPPPIFVEWR